MTCIVGVVENGHVYIGADSAGVGGYYDLTIRRDCKVFRNGAFLLGGTSSFRMLQLLRYAFMPPVYTPDTDLEKYMATVFVDAVRQCLKDGGFAQKSNEQETGGQFLVGFHGRLFCIYADYQVEEALCQYNAVGSGANVALGALYATPMMQAKKRLELALQAAEQHNAGVRAPFCIEMLEGQAV